MNITCATDNNYVRHCGVMLTSLLVNNVNEEIHVYLLTEGLSADNKESLKKIVSTYGGFFHYCIVDKGSICFCPIDGSNYLTLATYFRLLIPKILPDNVSKVIYLDCDLVINTSLIELWNIDITGYALAAVDEVDCQSSDVFERLCISSDKGYFNAGVLLMNLQYWRENDINGKCLEYIKKYPKRLTTCDQDALNAVLHTSWLSISRKWNMTTAFYLLDFVEQHRTEDDFMFILSHPAIIHFTWKLKPGDLGFCHPLEKVFFQYQDLTEWKSVKPVVTFSYKLKKIVMNILYSLRVKKRVFVKL